MNSKHLCQLKFKFSDAVNVFLETILNFCWQNLYVDDICERRKSQCRHQLISSPAPVTKINLVLWVNFQRIPKYHRYFTNTYVLWQCFQHHMIFLTRKNLVKSVPEYMFAVKKTRPANEKRLNNLQLVFLRLQPAYKLIKLFSYSCYNLNVGSWKWIFEISIQYSLYIGFTLYSFYFETLCFMNKLFFRWNMKMYSIRMIVNTTECMSTLDSNGKDLTSTWRSKSPL